MYLYHKHYQHTLQILPGNHISYKNMNSKKEITICYCQSKIYCNEFKRQQQQKKKN